MSDLKSSFPSDPDVLAVFREELARAALVRSGPALWPRFAGYYQGLARLPRRVRRALQRQWRRSLGGFALLLALGQAPALAATINVDSVSCTLIDAITAANNDGFAGGCSVGSGADTIVLPANSIHTLTAVHNTADGSPNGLPPITSTITIAGNGSTITRDPAAPDFRILLVRNNGGDLTLRETTVSGGRTIQFRDGGGVANDGVLSLVNSNVINNYSPRGGGGLHNDFGATLRLTNSTVSGNLAAFYGGGIRNRGNLTVTNSTVSGNSATQDGGGVISGGTLILLNSTISGNTAVQDGGGLRISGTATLNNSTVSGNSASQFGGGLYITGTATVTNSTISGNFARRNGGGLNNTRTMTLTTSTVSGNSTGENGGGVRNSSTLTLNETLISGNTASSQGPELYHAGGTVNANRSNLFGHDGDAGVTGFTPSVPDIVPGVALTAILDTALRENDGLTNTHALVAGSPAIDAGGTCFPTTDQRGIPRPQGADANGDGFPDCDIGAFEVGLPLPPPAIPPPGPQPVSTCQASTCGVRLTCQDTTTACTSQIKLTVRASAVRLGRDSLASATARRRITFAADVVNVPPGGTVTVRVPLTPNGKNIRRRLLNRNVTRLKGRLEVSNISGASVSNTPRTIRLIRIRPR